MASEKTMKKKIAYAKARGLAIDKAIVKAIKEFEKNYRLKNK